MKIMLFLLALGVTLFGMRETAGAQSNLLAHYEMNENVASDNAELVTNGNFASWSGDNPAGWTVTGESGNDPEVSEAATGEAHADTPTPSGGMCNIYTSDGTFISIGQTIVLVVGRRYRVSASVDTATSGGITVDDAGAGYHFSFGASSPGIFTSTFVATTTSMIMSIKRRVVSANDITFDDISLKLCAIEDTSGNDHDGVAQQDTDVIHVTNGTHLRTALVTFIFDDGTDTDYDVMKPVFDTQGEVACCAIISDLVGTSGKTTEAELVTLEGAGWEILSHTKTHPHLTALTEAQIITELSDSKTALEAMSLTVSNLAYPYNEYNSVVQSVAQSYYNSARIGGATTNNPMLDVYALSAKDADDHTALSTFKELVDTAESEQSWLIFYLHATDADDVTAMDGLIDYIQAKSISIVTVQQALDLAVSATALINGAFDFNGSSDYIIIPDHADFTPALTPFSISAWVNMDSALNFIIASKGNLGVDGEWRFRLNASGKLEILFYDESANTYIGRSYNTALTSYQNEWIYIAVTYDGGILSSGVKLYLNGVQVDDTNYQSGTFVSVENLTGDVYIGQNVTLHANGTIDNVYFFAAELTQDEINILYNGGAGTEIPAELDQMISPRRANLSPFSSRRRYEY